MISNLERKDWEEVLEIANNEIKAANRVFELQLMVKEIATEKLKKFPLKKIEEKIKIINNNKVY
jgi:hypothetical protein